MSQDLWTAVDGYITGLLVQADPVLDAALEASAAAGLPAINVAPNQGKLLMLLARLQGARSILEIGTLGGYSTIWLARALPAGGRLVTLEANPEYAGVARANLARAGFAEVAEVRVGPAAESLPRLVEEGAGPFDVVFIDADKPSTPEYFAWALRLARRGTLIVVDNVVRDGAGDPPLQRDGSRGAARERHRHSDRGEQGVRRLRARAGDRRPLSWRRAGGSRRSAVRAEAYVGVPGGPRCRRPAWVWRKPQPR
jgi:predicted O-methyltransferase YrrM